MIHATTTTATFFHIAIKQVPDKKASPETQEKTPGQPPPSKLTAHYTPVSPICNCCEVRD